MPSGLRCYTHMYMCLCVHQEIQGLLILLFAFCSCVVAVKAMEVGGKAEDRLKGGGGQDVQKGWKFFSNPFSVSVSPYGKG